MFWESCDERAERLAEYVIDTGATVRSTAAAFGISKSTVHKDLTHKLPKINKGLYVAVKEILEENGFTDVEIIRDYNDNDRIVRGTRNESNIQSRYRGSKNS